MEEGERTGRAAGAEREGLDKPAMRPSPTKRKEPPGVDGEDAAERPAEGDTPTSSPSSHKENNPVSNRVPPPSRAGRLGSGSGPALTAKGDPGEPAMARDASAEAVSTHIRDDEEQLDRVRSVIAEVDDLLGRNLELAAREEEVMRLALGRRHSEGRGVPEEEEDDGDDLSSSLDLSSGGEGPGGLPPVNEEDGEEDDDGIEILFGSDDGSYVSDLASATSAPLERLGLDLDAPDRMSGLDALRDELGRWQSEADVDDGNSAVVHAGDGPPLGSPRSHGDWSLAVGSLPLGSPRSHGTGATDVSDDIRVTPESMRGLVAELERVDSAYEAERSMEEAALMFGGAEAPVARRIFAQSPESFPDEDGGGSIGSDGDSYPGSASDTVESSDGEVSWIPEEGGSTATIDRGDDDGIDAIVRGTVPGSAGAGPAGGDGFEGSSVAPKESIAGTSSGGRLEKLAGDERRSAGDEQGSSGSGREAPVVSAAIVAAASAAVVAGTGKGQGQEDSPGSDQVAVEIPVELPVEHSVTTEESLKGEVPSYVAVQPSSSAEVAAAAAAHGQACQPTREEHGPAAATVVSSASTEEDARGDVEAASVRTPCDGSRSPVPIGLGDLQAPPDGEDGARHGGDGGDEIAIRFNPDEESTVSDLGSSTATPLGLSDGGERGRVWTGHGIAIDPRGVDVSEVGSRGESLAGEPAESAGDEQGSAGSSDMAVRSVPSAEFVEAATTDGGACQPPLLQKRSTGTAGSEFGGSQRKKVGEVKFDRPTRISLDDIHRISGNLDRSQSDPSSRSEGTMVQSVLIYPPVEVDVEDGICSGDGDLMDKSPTLEWVQRNIAQGGNSVEYVLRDSPIVPTAFNNSYKDVSGHTCDSVDEEMGMTTAVEVRGRRSDDAIADQRDDNENRDPLFITASIAPWCKGRKSRNCILAVLALFLVVAVSASVAGAMLPKRSSKELDAVAAIGSTASPSPSASRAPTTAASETFTAKPRPTAGAVVTSAPIINPTKSPTVTPTIQNTTTEPTGKSPSTGAPEAIESTASPSLSASQAPTTTASEVFTAKPSPTADVAFTSAPIINPTTSSTANPTIQSTIAEPPTATPTIQNTTAEPSSTAPSASAPEINEPPVDYACQLVTISVKYDNATSIGWTLVDTGDHELFVEGTYVDSFYSSDPDVVGQPQVTEDCLGSGSYRWFTYGDGGGSYSLATPSGIVEGEVDFRETVSFMIS